MLFTGAAIAAPALLAGPAAAAPVARADFDGDGYGDLAIGAPADSVMGQPAAGAGNVIYGSGRGLREDPDQLCTHGTAGVKGAVGPDGFGSALAGAGPGD